MDALASTVSDVRADQPALGEPAGLPQRNPADVFRAALLVLCAGLALIGGNLPGLAVAAGLLAALVVVRRTAQLSEVRVPIACAEAAVAGAAVVLTGGAESPLLPYLLGPAMALGLTSSVLNVGIGIGISAAALLTGHLLAASLIRSSSDALARATSSLEWLGVALAVGLITVYGRRIQAPVEVDRYAEARRLLGQLHDVAHRLPGGLDAPSAADAVLVAAADIVRSSRAAVLVHHGDGPLVPLAVRGTRRVPWRTPLSEPGPLQDAWETLSPVLDVRSPDAGGRRRGSALAVLPLSSVSGPYGLLVLESPDLDAFPPPVVQALQQVAAEASLRLETALLFEAVRSTVTVEERDRLAREMHDGVAQELAYIGYRLDELRSLATSGAPDLPDKVADVRRSLTTLVSDLRLSITDLRSTVSPDRGLGAVLSSYVRALGSGRGVRVQLSLEESAFRLPAEHEVVLFRVAQAALQGVRSGAAGSDGSHEVVVQLSVDPPSARLVVEHAGKGPALAKGDQQELSAAVSRLGGWLTTSETGGCRVEVVLEGGGDVEDDSAARR